MAKSTKRPSQNNRGGRAIGKNRASGAKSAEMKIVIDGWNSNLHFSACHTIPKHGKCERLHGHTYAVHATIWGALNEARLVLDFTEAKRALHKIIEELDHRVIVPTMSSSVRITKNKSRGEVEIAIGAKRYIFPREDVVFIAAKSSSAEDLSAYVLERFIGEASLSKNISAVEVGVDEGRGQGARVKKEL